ncbi:MAG: response regulator transcription factor [Betaproteobacteria bacterium]|nr:response regulator transcription factor [Betaproteobacteria bacterium]
MNIALLEDDPSQADLILHWLAEAGMRCTHYATGAAFRAAILSQHFDLILIDWTLPDDDGLAILEWLRAEQHSKHLIMFVTSRAEEASLVLALQRGADDYLVKPLRKGEMLARVQALLRRGGSKPAATVGLGRLQVDPHKQCAIINGIVIDLSERETKLAVHLLQNHGRVVSHQQLQEQVWQRRSDLDKRTIDTQINRLRSKLGLTPENGFSLSVVFHKGYRLEQLTRGDQDSDAA